MLNLFRSLYFVWYLIPSLFAFVLFVLKYSENLRNQLFAKIYWILSPLIFDHLNGEKEILFSGMSQLISYDKDLRSRGLIRVLEIGAGPGNNFKFFPKNVELIILEPNKYFERKRNENLMRYPEIRISKSILGVGENMKEVPDNSIDCVIGTFLQCSVRDNNLVLKEIHRVLSPVGKYFFMEHSCGLRTKFQWKFQKIIHPLWKIIFDGCHIIKNFTKSVKNNPLFENVEAVLFFPSDNINRLLVYCMGNLAYGTAQKSI